MKKIVWFALFTLLIYGLVAEEDAMSLFQRYNEDSNQENLFEAVEQLTKLMDEYPEDWQIPLLLSYMHYMELNGYIVHLQENLESLPNRVKFQFANLLLSLNQYEQSVEIYDMLTEALPNWSCAWRHKGEALYLANQQEEAENSLKEAIRTREEHYDAYVWLALVQKELGKPAEALETLKTGLTYYGKDIEDPDEEVDSMDVQFMLLELYRLNDLKDQYQDKRNKLMQDAPTDPRWDGVKFLSPTH